MALFLPLLFIIMKSNNVKEVISSFLGDYNIILAFRPLLLAALSINNLYEKNGCEIFYVYSISGIVGFSSIVMTLYGANSVMKSTIT